MVNAALWQISEQKMPLHDTSCSNQSPAGGEMRKSRAMRLPSAAQCGIFFMVLRKGCTS